jgi:MraZ protein
VSRFVFAGASETELDGQGRVMLPPPLLEHAGLSRDIVVAGVRDFLEIWDLDAWKRVQTESEGSVEDVTERLSQH